ARPLARPRGARDRRRRSSWGTLLRVSPRVVCRREAPPAPPPDRGEATIPARAPGVKARPKLGALAARSAARAPAAPPGPWRGCLVRWQRPLLDRLPQRRDAVLRARRLQAWPRALTRGGLRRLRLTAELRGDLRVRAARATQLVDDLQQRH